MSCGGDIENGEYDIREKWNDCDFGRGDRSGIDWEGNWFWNKVLKRRKGGIIDSCVKVGNLNICRGIVLKWKR